MSHERVSEADPVGALVPGTTVHINGATEGPLAGLTFVAKDLFDIAGFPTGGGNPDWPRNKPLPEQHAWAVQRLLEAGANLVGKTITDEISLGILGESMFDGTPINSAAPDRVPGGSSSGSAAAVAAGMADTGLGSDTGGSVRVPASFCGLYGIRPTHGRIDLTGMMSQAPTSDTCGWFARDAGTFARVSAVMLQEELPTALPTRLIVASDAFGFADEAVREALSPVVDRLSRLIGETVDEAMAPSGHANWSRAQRTIQPHEGWLNFKDWIDRENPRFAYSVARNLYLASTIPAADLNHARLVRREARARLDHLLQPGTILCLPTTPFPAPRRGLPTSETDPLREQISCLACHGGLTGVPQVSIPGATADGAPVGLSVVARWGEDAGLISVAQALANAEGRNE